MRLAQPGLDRLTAEAYHVRIASDAAYNLGRIRFPIFVSNLKLKSPTCPKKGQVSGLHASVSLIYPCGIEYQWTSLSICRSRL